MQYMAKVTENLVQADTAGTARRCEPRRVGRSRAGRRGRSKALIEAVDAFVFDWQAGKRPPPHSMDADDAPYALGSLWGEQLVRRFSWEWAMVTFHDHSVAPGVLSPDRALAVYPIHFLMGALKDAGVDVTIALSYNMLEAGKVGRLEPKGYLLMDGVRRIVPRR